MDKLPKAQSVENRNETRNRLTGRMTYTNLHFG